MTSKEKLYVCIYWNGEKCEKGKNCREGVPDQCFSFTRPNPLKSKETFRIPENFSFHRSGVIMALGIRLGVQYQQIMSDPDRRDALDPESLKELRKVTDMLREG